MNQTLQTSYLWEVSSIMTDSEFEKSKYQNKTLIIGLGKTGLSCARFLARQGISFIIMDDREQPPELAPLTKQFPKTELILGGFDTNVMESCREIIISPGVSLFDPEIARIIDDGIPVIGDIELFARYVDAPVIAVTGSNGKSTVTTLVAEMARAAGRDVRVGGNLGTPALDLLGDAPPDLYVLELSSFQLESTSSLNCAAAVVLNMSPDHLDRYRTMDEYLDAKLRIFRGDGMIIVNEDDPVLKGHIPAGRKYLGFTTGIPKQDEYGIRKRQGDLWIAKGTACLMPVSELRINGFHNVANALAALALGDAAGLPQPAMLQAVKTFKGLPHRMEWVAEKDGIAWYNDSKGTNVGATVAALRGIDGKVVLIAGGLGKGADFSHMQEVVADKARAVVLIGRDAALIARALGDVVPVLYATDMPDAVQQAALKAQQGDTVLLSPACASFDMFKNYEDRGTVFVKSVKRLLA
jgi:UDP-N-acetylmuramoylalanine--D-glutamate ligase